MMLSKILQYVKPKLTVNHNHISYPYWKILCATGKGHW